MKAITLWQPWAQLIVQGDKLIETSIRRSSKQRISQRAGQSAAETTRCSGQH